MKSDVGRVLEMIHGYRQTCLLVAGVQSGLFRALAAGSVGLDALCEQLELHEPSLRRYLRALQGLGMVTVEQDFVTLTPTGMVLGGGSYGEGLRAWSELVGGEYLSAWGGLGATLKTGEVAFEKTHGLTAWEHRQQHPTLNAAFQTVTSAEQKRALSGLLRVYDFSEVRSVADIGGGQGYLLRGVLDRAQLAKGLLYDLPQVVEGLELGHQVEVRAGSFLEEVPSGYERYLLKHVLHNWDDPNCVKILSNCARAMDHASRLLVIENVLPDEGAPPLELSLLDIHMMTVLGGQERRVADYGVLGVQGGLILERHLTTRAGAPDVLEFRKL